METFDGRPVSFYREFINKAVKTDITEIGEYSLRVGVYRVELARYILEEEELYMRLDEELKVIYRDRLRYYKMDYEEVLEKKDYETYILADDIYREASRKVKEQEKKVKFLERCMSILESQSYHLTTALKHEIWKSGGNV